MFAFVIANRNNKFYSPMIDICNHNDTENCLITNQVILGLAQNNINSTTTAKYTEQHPLKGLFSKAANKVKGYQSYPFNSEKVDIDHALIFA